MNAGQLNEAMTQMSGQRCVAACLVQNRTRLYLGIGGALALGVTVSSVIDQLRVGAIVTAVIIGAVSPLFDRRILALVEGGVLQARAATFTNTPVRMLPPVGNLRLEKAGRAPKFSIDGTIFLGATGAQDFVAVLARRRAG